MQDPLVANWRGESVARSFASVSAFPLRVNGEVEGNLKICAAEPDAFDEREIVRPGGARGQPCYVRRHGHLPALPSFSTIFRRSGPSPR